MQKQLNLEEYLDFCKKLIPIINDLRYAYLFCKEKNTLFSFRTIKDKGQFIKIFYDMFISKKSNNHKKYNKFILFNNTGEYYTKYNYFLNIMSKGSKFNSLENILKEGKDPEKEIKYVHNHLRNKYILELILKR